jgi:hypothetical protein
VYAHVAQEWSLIGSQKTLFMTTTYSVHRHGMVAAGQAFKRSPCCSCCSGS